MVVSGFSHTGIHVTDLRRSIRFYERVGLTVVARRTKSELYTRRLVGYPAATLEVAIMSIPGSDAVLEVIEYRDANRSPVDTSTANPGTTHFCLLVRDLDVLHARLVAEGVRFVSDVQTPTAGPNEGGRVVYMLDPDGICVELLQTTRTMTGAPLVPGAGMD
jgi:catechol 2,3-dioxygenase-like lactoylglutathione lyase family enzyme